MITERRRRLADAIDQLPWDRRAYYSAIDRMHVWYGTHANDPTAWSVTPEGVAVMSDEALAGLTKTVQALAVGMRALNGKVLAYYLRGGAPYVAPTGRRHQHVYRDMLAVLRDEAQKRGVVTT